MVQSGISPSMISPCVTANYGVSEPAENQPDTITEPVGVRSFFHALNAGFTMIELLITIVISVILLIVALPSFRSSTQAQQANAELNNLRNDLQFARSEAQKEGQTITACVSIDGATCTTTSGWQAGWIIFSDSNGSQQVDAASDLILRIQKGWSSGDVVSTSPSAVPVSAVSYGRDGFALNMATTGVLLTLRTTPINTFATRCLVLDIMGRQQIQMANQAMVSNQTAACL